MTWMHLDEQMAAWSDRLVSEIKIADQDSRKLATQIASDVRFLPADAKAELAAASPVPLNNRLQELQAFQGWMDIVHRSNVSPIIVRAQVITQNYICFVYLPESCFRVLSKAAPSGSVARKCAQYLATAAFVRFEMLSRTRIGVIAVILKPLRIGLGRAVIRVSSL